MSPTHNYSQAQFTGSISSGVVGVPGTILTVDSLVVDPFNPPFNNSLVVGETISGPGVVPGTIITAFLTGTGDVGTYEVNISQYIPDPTDLSAAFAFPSQVPGYIVQVTNAGELQVQGNGAFGNVISGRPQILMPCSITYSVKSTKKICDNITLSTRPTDTTQFISLGAQKDGVRDSHVNDVYNGVVAWAWTDNSMVADKTNGVMDCMVCIGRTTPNGELIVNAPINLTNFPSPVTGSGIQAWDTAVAIVRDGPNKGNIVVSWGQIDRTVSPRTSLPFRAVSTDGGKTWPINGPMNVPPTFDSFGDNRGVSSDKFGNVWYSCTNFFDDSFNLIDQPYFAVSTDGGVNYSLVYTAPAPEIPGFPQFQGYDYPQFCFGTDENGNYGLYFKAEFFFDSTFIDFNQFVGFIPIQGLGLDLIGTATTATVAGNLAQTTDTADITASSDVSGGRVWLYGQPLVDAYSYIHPSVVGFKSPGPLDENWAGVWDINMMQQPISLFFSTGNSGQNSQLFGYLPMSVKSILFDDSRQALYAMVAAQSPNTSQDMNISFLISRDNGMTWSAPIEINNTDFANRGMQSMAVDTVTGNLIFGWYDGRNDPNYQKIEYMAAIIPAKTLNKLVNKLPLFNPLFVVPASDQTVALSAESHAQFNYEQVAEGRLTARRDRVRHIN